MTDDAPDETTATGPEPGGSRKRAVLIAAAAAAAVVALGVTAWAITSGSPAPAATPSASASPSASATPSPTPTPSASFTPSPEPVSYEGRNPGMSDEEALYRAEHPATGEVWLDEPVEVEAPTGVDPYFRVDQWWHVGDRDGSRILVPSGFLTPLSIVEVAPDGAARELSSPLPSDPAPSGDTATGLPASEAYYDSLSLPATLTGPDGLTMDPRERGTSVAGLADGFEGPEYTPVATYGAISVVRRASRWDDSHGTYYAQDAAPHPADPRVVAGLELGLVVADRVENVNYFLEYPFGFGVEIVLDPLGTDEPAADGRVYRDMLDQGCANVMEYASLDTRADPAEWIPVEGSHGVPWYTPTSDNDLAHAFYDFAATNTLGWLADAGVHSFEDYREQRMMLGTPAADGYGWWVVVDGRASVRVAC
ncbi:hypothetical protein [Demequina maris]|uniref:hypothetical protein n=1 Tax=Demequina maris TaxID=1638982 RepID=UPI000782844A|nr:hypothetical protein [Demequina maris]